MFASLSVNLLSFEQVYKAGNGQNQIEYVLDRDLTMTLVTGYDVAMRHRVMRRWSTDENDFRIFMQEVMNE